MKRALIFLATCALAVAAPAQDEDAPAATLTADGSDHLTLQSTAVTGNKELPKVLYIVPWKKAEGLDEPGTPANSLIDEILAPVDRSEFKRELAIHDQLDAAIKRESQNSKSEDSQEE